MAHTSYIKFCKHIRHCNCQCVEPTAVHRVSVFKYAGVVAETTVVAVELDGLAYLVFVFGGGASVVAYA